MSEKKDQSENIQQNQDPNYWRSFEELYANKEFLNEKDIEFKEGVSDSPELSKMSPVSRRKFLALIGASAAFAGTACTDYYDKGEIVPYNKKPEEITLGKANYYASVCNGCSSACGVLIKTREGRPIKVDGNPDHPISKGKICSQGQAGIMNLYDPDRLKAPLRKIQNRIAETNWEYADENIRKALNEAGDKEIAIITNQITSPTENKVLNDFTSKYPSAKVYSYEQFNDEIRNSAWKKCYGTDHFPVLKWNEAKLILTLDGDLLGTDSNRIENARLFAEGRDVIHKKFNRLYVVEGNLSLTGMNADYRLRLRSDAQYKFVMSIINELQKRDVIGTNVNTSGFALANMVEEFGLSEKSLNHLLIDLKKYRGKTLVYAGEHLPEKVHIAVNLLNEALGNTRLYDSQQSKVSVRPLSSIDELKNLVNRMSAGKVGTVIHYASNPVYNFPSDFNYIDALKNVENVITLTEIVNESGNVSNYVLPLNHSFESWGDSKVRTGFYALQQPVIAPIYNSRQKESVLLTWMNGEIPFIDTLYHDYLINNWENEIYPTLKSSIEFKRFWYGALHDGVTRSDDKSTETGSFNFAVTGVLGNDEITGSGITVQIKESYSLGDGRNANNGWLQESPHPVSKVTWDNYAAISVTTAKKLGVEKNDMIELSLNGNTLLIPAFVQPGLADDFISVETGYGRAVAGSVGSNVGFNVNKFFNTSGGLTPWLYSNVKVKKGSGSYNLVVAQAIYDFTEENKKDLPEKRGIIREGNVDEYLKDNHFLHKDGHHELESVNPPFPYDNLKWGMSIDLNKCLGCSECFTACNVENNIPIVGKDQVEVGREMHWLRIDRYYSGTSEDPQVSTQPMLCQHCDQAPCENVCPVAATTHSPDGLNQMVYNRCVGTRYCSNNCPYKVRRFNFFNYRSSFNDAIQESPVFALLHNPEVTVRSRGVMEKCTFCIQRIMDAKSDATKDGREIKGSDVKTACQEACVTNAIQFGDINNKEEEFYKYRNHELGFYVLEELNIKPNVTYIAKLRNTHPEVA
jgi:molybdopterin-containing oxidoreductase family iron-sulfur binding subunit